MAEQQRLLGGRYLLKEKVGTGGMATVFRAQDQVLNRAVAVKIMLPQYAGDPTFAARFKQEAQAAAALQSPYIVGVYDWGKDGDTYYIVMELLHGTDLKSGVRSHGALDPKKVAQIGSQICGALSIAHRHEIIHRDIKPQNILVNSEGLIKVADFGIARVAGSSTLSKGDNVMGSVHYFSPEQARGEDVTFASDIYSVGVVLYEMLTGQVPFDGDTPVSVAMQHISAQPKPPSLLADGISPAMEQVVLTAMSKEPRNRYRDAADMARAVRAALDHPDVAAGTVSQNTASQRTRSVDTGRNAVVARQRKRQRMRETLLILGLTLAALAVLSIGTVEIVRNIVNTVEAPYLIGETEENARRMGEDRGLRVEVTRQSDNKTPAGLVIMQSREYQYRMKRGDVILITVSTGPEKQGVPALLGKLLSQAQAEGEKYGFKVLASSYAESDQPFNTVLEQTPAAGEMLAYGEIIQVVVSGSVAMPRLTDMTSAQAIQTARSTGMNNIQIVETPTSDPARIGRVADQLPKEGERVMYDAAVTLAVYVQAATNAPQSTDASIPTEGKQEN